LLLLTMRVSDDQWQAAGALQIVTVETIAYAISWVAFPLAMLTVTRWIGRAPRFFDFMVPYNWWQLPQSALFLIVGLQSQSAALGVPAAQMLELVVVAGVLVYEWYIARVTLDTTASAALLVVVLDLALGALIDRVASNLY